MSVIFVPRFGANFASCYLAEICQTHISVEDRKSKYELNIIGFGSARIMRPFAHSL